MNVGNIINEKKNNFSKFLTEKILNNQKVNDESKKKINEYIDLIQNTSVDQFIFYIQKEIIKYKNKTNIFVENLFIIYDITEKEIEKEDIEKFKRYLDLFIKLISNDEN